MIKNPQEDPDALQDLRPSLIDILNSYSEKLFPTTGTNKIQ